MGWGDEAQESRRGIKQWRKSEAYHTSSDETIAAFLGLVSDHALIVSLARRELVPGRILSMQKVVELPLNITEQAGRPDAEQIRVGPVVA